MNTDAVAKAIQAAREMAEQRLRWGARALQNVVPANAVLLSTKGARKAATFVELVWPGTLRELDSSGELIAQVSAADMFDMCPQAAELITSKAKGRPVLATLFTSAQGSQLRTSMDAAGVVCVHSVRTKDLLAVSEPGEPTKLRADFQPLKPEDLRPRIQ